MGKSSWPLYLYRSNKCNILTVKCYLRLMPQFCNSMWKGRRWNGDAERNEETKRNQKIKEDKSKRRNMERTWGWGTYEQVSMATNVGLYPWLLYERIQCKRYDTRRFDLGWIGHWSLIARKTGNTACLGFLFYIWGLQCSVRWMPVIPGITPNTDACYWLIPNPWSPRACYKNSVSELTRRR